MSKKSKTKKVSQNDLRKMMNEMKSKRSTTGAERRTLPANSDTYRKALEDQRRIEELKKGIAAEDDIYNVNTSKIAPKSYAKSAMTATKRALPKDNESRKDSFKEPMPKTAKVAKSDEIPISKKPGGLPLGDYGSSSDEDDESQPPQKKTKEGQKDVEKTEESNPTSSLPEGFFDDPEVDAKIRGVETPSSAMDREWEDFQREIQKETGQSEQIIDEEEEIVKVDREIEEINEQIFHFSRVEKLNVARDEVKEKLKSRDRHEIKNSETKSVENVDVESDDESVDEDTLDWREKDSLF